MTHAPWHSGGGGTFTGQHPDYVAPSPSSQQNQNAGGGNVNPYQQAAESMLSQGITSLSGTTGGPQGGQAQQEQMGAGFIPVSVAAQEANLLGNIQEAQEQAAAAAQAAAAEEKSAKIAEDFRSKIMGGLNSRTIRNLTPLQQKMIDQIMSRYKPYSGGLLESFVQSWKDRGGFLSGKDQGFRKKDGKIIFDESGNPERTREGVIDLINQMGAGKGSASVMESLRKYDPQTHFEITGMPATSGGLESFGRNETIKAAEGEKLTKEEQRYNNAIYAAREAGRGKNKLDGGFKSVSGDPMIMSGPSGIAGALEEEAGIADLTPTGIASLPTATGVANLTPTGLNYASMAPQFGPQYPGYLNQGVMDPNLSQWYEHLSNYYS